MAIFEPLFEALGAARVRYVVVGGLAVVLHGHTRLTADLDLAIDLSPDAARLTIDTLTREGFVPQLPVPAQQFADERMRQSWVREKGMQVFSLWHPQRPMSVIDLFVEDPIPFEDLWKRSVEVQLGKTSIRIASIDDLIEMKQKAGRPKDLDDIVRLQEIRRLEAGDEA